MHFEMRVMNEHMDDDVDYFREPGWNSRRRRHEYLYSKKGTCPDVYTLTVAG